MKTLTIRDILEKVIDQVGGDGLCDTDIGCGCILGDLAPCDCNIGNCEVGKNNFKLAGSKRCEYWLEPLEFDNKTISVTLTKRCEVKS